MTHETAAKPHARSEQVETYVAHLGWIRHAPGDEVAQYLGEGWFEHLEQAFLWMFLRPGDMVVDAGAHVGLFTTLAAKVMQRQGTVLSIEPAPATLTELNANIRSFDIEAMVDVLPCAVAAETGVATLHVNTDGQSAFNSLHGIHDAKQAVEVPTRTLDEILEAGAIDAVDFMKLDVEGAEIDVLMGATRSIAAGRLPIVMIEFAEHMLRAAGRSTGELADAWRESGYTLMRFDPATLRLTDAIVDGPVWYENLFAVRSVDWINERLTSASPDHQRIACDLIARGRSAERLRERGDDAKRLKSEIRRLCDAFAEVDPAAAQPCDHTAGHDDDIQHINASIAGMRTFHQKSQEAITAANQRVAELEAECELATQHIAESRTALRTAEEDRQRVAADHDRLTQQFDALRQRAERYGRSLQRVCGTLPIRVAMKLRPQGPPPWLATLPTEVEELASMTAAGPKHDSIPLLKPSNPASEDADTNTTSTEEEADPPRARATIRVADQPCAISVVICTYNPRMDLLHWTLDSIREQSFDHSRWELVIVDNNSSTPLTVEELDPDQTLPLRIVREERPGLTFARVAGIDATSAPLMIFVDDDNALEPNYLEASVKIADANPEIGAFGGIAEAELEEPIAPWMHELLGHLGVRNYGDETITSHEQHWGLWDPIGAGMVIRREVGERFAQFVGEEDAAGGLGRKGGNLMSGEDTLFARCGNMVGYACSYQPELKLRHYMKKERLNRQHLARTIEGHGRSYVMLERMLGRSVHPITGFKAKQFLLKRLLFRIAKSGRTGYVNWYWDRGYVAASRETGAEQT